MNYKREEPFRFVFNPPLTCSFSIIEIGAKPVNTSTGSGEVLDLSPKGLKLRTKLNIPFREQEVKVKISFKVTNDEIIADGILMWGSRFSSATFHYGVKFVNTSVLPQIITEELKSYSKIKLNNKNKSSN